MFHNVGWLDLKTRVVVFLNRPQTLLQPNEMHFTDGNSRKLKDEQAFELGRRLHFALRYKMLKLPISRFPTI